MQPAGETAFDYGHFEFSSAIIRKGPIQLVQLVQVMQQVKVHLIMDIWECSSVIIKMGPSQLVQLYKSWMQLVKLHLIMDNWGL